MLKIKDNVNLKELEKYGFKAKPYCYNGCGSIFEGVDYEYLIVGDYKGNQYIRIFVDKNHNLSLDIDMEYATYNVQLTILYDLIQAGLVEKGE